MVNLKGLLPFHFEFRNSKESRVITINTDNLKDGECKIVTRWNWAKFRYDKYAVCYKDGKIDISEIK